MAIQANDSTGGSGATVVSGAPEPPPGYRPANRWSESVFPFICLYCGATVGQTATEQHSAWHQRLWERLGTI